MSGPDDRELDAQLRAYIDGAAPHVGSGHAVARARRRLARRRAAGIAAIAALAIALGGSAIAIAANGGGKSVGPAGTTAAPTTRTTVGSTTTTATTTTTTATTTASSLEPTTVSVAPVRPPAVTTPTTGTWRRLVTGPDGVFAFRTRQRNLGVVARLDAQGRIVAQADVAIDDLRLDVAGYLFGTLAMNGAVDREQVIDARTLRIVAGSDRPFGLLAGRGDRVWTSEGSRLRARTIASGPTLSPGPTITLAGAPPADLAIDPSGRRLYVLQFDALRQQALLSVRSAADGRLLVAPKVVGGGPGPGRIAAAGNGVWLVQPTGTQGTVRLFSADSLAPIGDPASVANTSRIRVDDGLALLDIPGAEAGVRCLDPLARGNVVLTTVAVRSNDVITAYSSDGTRLYIAIDGRGVEVRAVASACRP